MLQQQAQFLFTCKPESHATLYEWVADLSRIGGVTTLVQSRRTGKKVFTDTWRYVNQVPLRNSDDALMVNWFELVTTDAEGKVLFRNAWATSHEISYHFEHNFGHGKQHLSNLFATLILLAFLVHTTLECIDTAFQSVRKALPSRQTFFEHLRALIQYLPFDNWTHLMQFMLQHLTPESIDSG